MWILVPVHDAFAVSSHPYSLPFTKLSLFDFNFSHFDLWFILCCLDILVISACWISFMFTNLTFSLTALNTAGYVSISCNACIQTMSSCPYRHGWTRSRMWVIWACSQLRWEGRQISGESLPPIFDWKFVLVWYSSLLNPLGGESDPLICLFYYLDFFLLFLLWWT